VISFRAPVCTTGKHVITSAVEHSAVLRPCQDLEKRGCTVTFLGVDQDGNLDLAKFEAANSPGDRTGFDDVGEQRDRVLFPVEKIAEICRRKGLPLSHRAVQAVGKIPMRLRDTAINLLSLSAHKLHGPKGIGALYVNRQTRFSPLIAGGSQENGRRGGTENVTGIVALGKRPSSPANISQKRNCNIRSIRDRFEKSALEAVSGASVNGAGAARIPTRRVYRLKELNLPRRSSF